MKDWSFYQSLLAYIRDSFSEHVEAADQHNHFNIDASSNLKHTEENNKQTKRKKHPSTGNWGNIVCISKKGNRMKLRRLKIPGLITEVNPY